jgi:hypothetical protein
MVAATCGVDVDFVDDGPRVVDVVDVDVAVDEPVVEPDWLAAMFRVDVVEVVVGPEPVVSLWPMIAPMTTSTANAPTAPTAAHRPR